MKATAKKTLSVEKATKLVSEIKEIFSTLEENPNFCGWIKKGEKTIWGDSYGAEIGWFEEKKKEGKTVSFWNDTCGGSHHKLSINIEIGLLTVTHQGRRASEKPSLLYILKTTSFIKFYINGWELIENDSSRQDWAIKLALLEGKFGSGPCNLREELALKEEKLRKVYKKLGLKWPEGVELGHEKGKPQRQKEWEKCSSPKNALYYKRAGAMGIPT